MKKLHFFKLLFCATLVAAVTAFTGCSNDDTDEVKTPELEVSPTEIAFDENGGTKTFDITTTGRWAITGAEGATWLAVTPALVGTGNQKITLTAGPDSQSHSVTLKVTVFATIYGVEKALGEKEVKVTQSPGGEQPSDEIIFTSNFDKELATQTFGPSGTSWPFLDQFDGWQNQSGTGAAGVTYEYKNMSVRTSQKQSGGYEGASSQNKIFFGAAPADLTIQNITLPAGKTKFKLLFGAAHSKNVDGVYDNTFKPESFNVTLGNGTEWSGNVTYEKVGGGDTADPFWTYFAVNFTLSAPVEKLSVKFTATLASVFAMDDVKLVEGIGGQLITLGSTPPPSGESLPITIPELNAKCVAAGNVKGVVVDAVNDRTFEAVVVTDKEGGNFNKLNLNVMTPGATTENNGIVLYGSGQYTDPSDPAYTLKKGDKIKVTLKANLAQVTDFQGLHEVTGAQTTTWLTVEKIGTETINPVTITVDKLAAFQGMVVTVNGATAPAAAAVWCTDTAFGVHTFTVGGTNMVVFAQANMPGFAGLPFVANATGNITGYATVNKTIPQICPQTRADAVAFMTTDPVITGINPASLSFAATGETVAATVSTANADGCTIEASSDNAQFTVTVAGNTVSVVAPANATTAAINGTLTVNLMKTGNIVFTKTAAMKQVAPGAVEAGYESMSAFVVTVDNSTNAVYSLKDSKVDGQVATGIKFGTGSKAGVYTSAALGLTGNKTLSFFGTAWKAKTATVYIRVNSGGSVAGTASTALKPNDDATGNPPFVAITVTDSDYYTFNLEGLTAASTVTISTNSGFTAADDGASGRAVLFGIQVQ